MMRMVTLMWFVLLGVAAMAGTPRIDLTGVVRDEEGAELAGARVYIQKAVAKGNGPAETLSSSLDCEKSATADAAGQFLIPELDSGFTFTVFAAAAGYKGTLARDVDPAGGDVSILLRRRSDFESSADIVGMVLDPGGRPLEGAVAEVVDIMREGRRAPNTDEPPAVDPVVITDGRGRFVLGCHTDVSAVRVMVHGPQVSRRLVDLLSGKDQYIRMETGCRVTGRIEMAGLPVDGVEVVLSH